MRTVNFVPKLGQIFARSLGLIFDLNLLRIHVLHNVRATFCTKMRIKFDLFRLCARRLCPVSSPSLNV